MKTIKRFKDIALAAVFAVGLLASLVPLPAGAQNSSSSLSIPPRKNYVVEPGKSVSDTAVISNLDGSNPLILSLRVIDFSYTNETGTPKLFLSDTAPQTTWSLKPYLSVPETVTVPAKSTKTINLGVSMPANIGAGSYYSAIVYSSGSGQGGNVGLSASGVTLVFVTVPGKVSEDLQVKDLGAYDLNSPKPGYELIATNKPGYIGYTLKNNGNVTEAPGGIIKLHYMFGGDQDIDNINPNNSLALIGQTRTFTACIKLEAQSVNFDGAASQAPVCQPPDLWPGMYTVSFDAFYGQNGNETKEITRSAVFWYLPLWFIIAFVAVLLILAFVIWRLSVKIKRRRNGDSSKQSKK